MLSFVNFCQKTFSIEIINEEIERHKDHMIFQIFLYVSILEKTVALNGLFIITKNFRHFLIHNFCLNIFSIEAIDGEIEKLQKTPGGSS